MMRLSAAARDALANVDYRGSPSVLLFADSAEAGERGRRMAGAAGCRVSETVPLGAAAARLARQVTTDAAVLEIDRDPGADLDQLLAAFARAAEAKLHSSIVIAPRRLRDRLSATPLPEGVRCLFEPSALDRVIALKLATVRRPSRLHDVKGHSTPRLQQLSEEVGRIASILAALSEQDHDLGVDEEEEEGEERTPVDASFVRSLIRARRLRDQFFKGDLFADPAWDMLLDLFAARLEDRRVAVSSLCIAAAVPPTTALRWIKALSDQGLFVRTADPQDGRRVFIQLSDEAALALESYLRAAQRISPLAL